MAVSPRASCSNARPNSGTESGVMPCNKASTAVRSVTSLRDPARGPAPRKKSVAIRMLPLYSAIQPRTARTVTVESSPSTASARSNSPFPTQAHDSCCRREAASPGVSRSSQSRSRASASSTRPDSTVTAIRVATAAALEPLPAPAAAAICWSIRSTAARSPASAYAPAASILAR